MSTAIKIENLYKEYQLGVIGHGTLVKDLQSWWASVKGEEDPNSLIERSDSELSGDRILAVNGINLDVNSGEILGIVGGNGAGKSTLLKVISRVTAPTKGVIKIKGRIASLLEVGTGFHGELTGRENIYLNGAINGMYRAEVKKKIEEIVDFSGVEKFLDTPVKRYSSGMFVRLGFAVAAHLEPDILVVDEVLAVGDASFQKKAIGKMRNVSQDQGRTVLFVSHNMESIKNLCTRAILLRGGKIINDGAPEEIVNYYLESTASATTGPEITFQDKPEKDYKILSFGVLNDEGDKSDYLDCTKPFRIFIDYLIKKPSDDLSVYLGISTASNEKGVATNTTVLGWSDKIYRKHKFNNEKIHKSPGKYRAHINFPGYLLNKGKYLLRVHLIYSHHFFEFNEEGVVFTLFDDNSAFHRFQGDFEHHRAGPQSGVLAMPLDWNDELLSTN